MFKVGGYYVTAKGRLAKIVSEFKYQDGGVFSTAIHLPGTGWVPDRMKTTGVSMFNVDYNMKEIDDFKGFLTYCKIVITFDHISRTWTGGTYDLTGQTAVTLTGIENQERALKLLQLGAQEKVLTWI